MKINDFIPCDDLYWSNEDRKYTALSKEELSLILKNVDFVFSDNDIMNVIDWATQTRVNHLLLKGVLENKLSIVGIDGSQVSFSKKDDEYETE